MLLPEGVETGYGTVVTKSRNKQRLKEYEEYKIILNK